MAEYSTCFDSLSWFPVVSVVLSFGVVLFVSGKIEIVADLKQAKSGKVFELPFGRRQFGNLNVG